MCFSPSYARLSYVSARHSFLFSVMGGIASVFNPPQDPAPGPLPEIASRSRTRRTKKKGYTSDEPDVPTVIKQTKARIERFQLDLLNKQREAKKIWDDPKARKIPHKKKLALNYMKQAKQIEQKIDELMYLLSNTEGVEASVETAENHRYIASQMRRVKTIVDQQAKDMPDIRDIGDLKDELDVFRKDMAEYSVDFGKLFTDRSDLVYEEMTLEEEDGLMFELDNLVLPETEDVNPPDDPSAGAELADGVSEEDLDRLLADVPDAPTTPLQPEEPEPPSPPKRKVALLL